ncbi:MAG: hypothetical protein NTZ50_13330 [Chloroflexi bacterium]|nr:hypothetical protein [Chloroflexota bacterium]
MPTSRRNNFGASSKVAVPVASAPRRWLLPLIVGVAALFIAVGGAFAAAKFEETDANCASCHTQPEMTFVDRAADARVGKAVDLASAHAAVPDAVRCIDCHSGQGVTGRLGAMTLGATDALHWVVGTAHQPAITQNPLTDEHCLKCHSEVLNDRSFNGHFHRFLPRWQQQAASQGVASAGCISCHTGHNTDGQPQLKFLQRQYTVQVCEQCHRALGASGD